MIYLISKIVISLLAALAIGFGMAWMLQKHLAARLREQLNSVIFETKSRIPQLESEITNRDQAIDGLREELAAKPKDAQPAPGQASNKEQEKQIDELRQQVIDLENELRMSRGVSSEETVFEIAEEDRVTSEEPELMSDDEFLTDIQDIFEDADDSIEAFGSSSADDKSSSNEKSSTEDKSSAEDKKISLEEELQSELDGWEDDSTDTDEESGKAKNNVTRLHSAAEQPDDTDASKAKPPLRAGPVDLKAELLELEGKIRSDEESDTDLDQALDENDIESLRKKVQSLTEARKALSETVESQKREVAGLETKRDLQDKSLTVLNQQLELARVANERILRELRQLKDGKPPKDDKSHSATAG